MPLIPRKPVRSILLLLSLPLVPGCGRTPEAVPTPTPERRFLAAAKDEHIVCVTLADFNPGTKPIPSEQLVKLSHSKGEVAHWVFCGDGNLKITWKPGETNPFEDDMDEGGKHVRSAKPRKAAISPKPYRYTITITIKDKGTFTNDPEVEIMP